MSIFPQQFSVAECCMRGSLFMQFFSMTISWRHISQGRVATRLRCGGIFKLLLLLQIYHWVQQWKNFENRLRFDKVTAMSLVVHFFGTPCRILYALSAWGGYLSRDSIDRLDAIFKKAVRLKWTQDCHSFDQLLAQCDCRLFSQSTHSNHCLHHVFGRPFVKRFALFYRSVVCPVCDVRALWPNGWTDQDETWRVDIKGGSWLTWRHRWRHQWRYQWRNSAILLLDILC